MKNKSYTRDLSAHVCVSYDPGVVPDECVHDRTSAIFKDLLAEVKTVSQNVLERWKATPIHTGTRPIDTTLSISLNVPSLTEPELNQCQQKKKY